MKPQRALFDNPKFPKKSYIVKRVWGFHYILDGLNAEQYLIAKCIGDGYWLMDRVTCHTCEREVFLVVLITVRTRGAAHCRSIYCSGSG